MGASYGISIALNNVSFGYISLTCNSIFKSLTPFLVVLFSFIIEGKTVSYAILAFVNVIVGGAILSIPFGSSSGSTEWAGYIFVSLAQIIASLRVVISAKLMSGTSGGTCPEAPAPTLSALAVSFYDALIGFLLLLPAAMVLEVSGARVYNQDINPLELYFGGEDAWQNVGIFFGGCVLAGFYTPVFFLMIKLTSSLGFVIIGSVKQVVLLVMAATIVDHIGAENPLLWIGLVVVLLGSLGYSYQSTVEKQAALAASEQPRPKKPTEGTPLKGANQA